MPLSQRLKDQETEPRHAICCATASGRGASSPSFRPGSPRADAAGAAPGGTAAARAAAFRRHFFDATTGAAGFGGDFFGRRFFDFGFFARFRRDFDAAFFGFAG